MKGFIKERQSELALLYPEWEKKTIWKFFEATANRFPDREFVVTEDGEHYTYKQAKNEALVIAQSLLRLGVCPGDHVAMQMENSAKLVFIALAVAAVRAVKVPVNISLGQREVSYIVNQSEASFLFAGCPVKLTGVETKLRKIIVLPGTECEADIPVVAWEDFLVADGEEILPDNDGEQYADEISDIVYTSGSTSAPKGVLLTHDMLMRNVFASCFDRGVEIGRRIFVPLPLFHVFGYVKGLLSTILVGGTILLRKGKFQAEPALKFMREGCANDVLCVPAQMRLMINYLRETPMEFPALHAVWCSASVCPAWIWPGIRESFHVTDVITSYGMSETCSGVLQTRPGDGDEILRTRVGRILPGGCAGLPEYGGNLIEYQVTDPKTGLPCKKGEVGELWCRGAVVTKGYFHRPEINAKAFTEDGWFKTGDCGHFDEDGYLILAGRMDDMYKINGENVSPKFLEDTVSGCPAVNVIAVVGVPDMRHGYVGAAFIQLHEDTPEHRGEAEQYCREHLAKFQVPKYFIYITEADWPRTATGKIQKFRLRGRALSMLENKELV